MNAPRWTRWLLGRLAPSGRTDEVLGDLEEAHRTRLRRQSAMLAYLLTSLEALDMAWALLRARGGPSGMGMSWLDFKLGLRMLVKHPGLAVLGGLSMAFAIFTGAGVFEFAAQIVHPNLPLPEGDRVVAIRLWDAARSGVENQALYDLGVWREELETVEELGAFRTVERNLITEDGRAEPVSMAVIDAAGFRVAAVPPRLGRPLTEDDHRPGSPPVAVIGHELWGARFGRDPEVVGTTVRLGDTPTTVVGVMPEGFGFPVSHQMWVPFHTDASAPEPRQGPGVTVFGRLAPGASLEDARVELDVLARRMAAAFPATHEHLRPEVMPYAVGILGIPASFSGLLLTAAGIASNIPLILFLVLVCGNVALLMFARASAREAELVVRSALGASRRRLVLQLFTEALVLASVAAVAGLAAAHYGLAWLFRITENIVLEGSSLPFWFHPSLSRSTLFYTGLLTVVAAAVAGILPGIKVTRGLRSGLQQASAGGGGFRFGGIWTGFIALQIAVTMIFPLLVLATRAQSADELAEDLDLAGDQYVSARLEMDPPTTPASGPGDGGEPWLQDTFDPTIRRLQERLTSEPAVVGVTFTERLPRQYHPWRQIEVDGPTAEPRDERGHRLGSSAVAVNYFEVMGAEVLAGRVFRPSDLEDGTRMVVVNESFVRSVLGGRNAVGQRVRYLATEADRAPEQEPGPWHEIVGVVEDLGTRSGYGAMGMYHPVAVGELHPVRIVMQLRGDARSFIPTLRNTAAGVDPTLRLDDVLTLDEVTQGQREFFAFWSTLLTAASGIALLLSLGGIFAVMSFSVSQRTREIGIRVALGSSRARIVTSIFRRPLVQVALGILAGAVVMAALRLALGDVRPSMEELLAFAAYVVLMTFICLLACISPTLRAVSVEPGEALRVEG